MSARASERERDFDERSTAGLWRGGLNCTLRACHSDDRMRDLRRSIEVEHWGAQPWRGSLPSRLAPGRLFGDPVAQALPLHDRKIGGQEAHSTRGRVSQGGPWCLREVADDGGVGRVADAVYRTDLPVKIDHHMSGRLCIFNPQCDWDGFGRHGGRSEEEVPG
jgi:hypothetical protein